MIPKQVYEVSAEDFEKAIESKLSQIVKDSLLSRYENIIVSAPTACEILGIHITTLYRYVGSGILSPFDHQAKADYKFNLRMLLEFNMNDVKHKRIRSWKNSQSSSRSCTQDTASHA